MRIARDCGDVSSLYPPGIATLRDMPFTLHHAISTALAFLSFEELPKDERPSRSIWFDGDAMKTHWEAVLARREEKYGSGGDGGDDSQMEHNSFLDEFFVK